MPFKGAAVMVQPEENEEACGRPYMLLNNRELAQLWLEADLSLLKPESNNTPCNWLITITSQLLPQSAYIVGR